MTSTTALADDRASGRMLVSLQGVADLAHVRRPAVSMWRRRFRSGPGAFPQPVPDGGTRLVFDAAEVAQWLEATGHGNNADARADAAATATPADLSLVNPRHVAELEALIVLQAQSGPLANHSLTTLLNDATRLDPDDLHIQSEIMQHLGSGLDWRGFADQIVNAAYSPAGALDAVARRSEAAASPSGSNAPLGSAATELLTAFLGAWPPRPVMIGQGIDAGLGVRIASTLSEDTALSLTTGSHARRLRRRLVALGVWITEGDVPERSIRVDRVPHRANDTDADALNAIDELALELGADDVAVVLGPARFLTDALAVHERGIRADVLRTDRVRAVVRLPAGLVPGATRESLALWILGPAPSHVPVDDRYTAVADLTDVTLTPARQADLVSDLIASVGTWDQARARAYRFVSLQRTSSLRARTGALVSRHPRSHVKATDTIELAARIAEAARELGDDHPGIVIDDSAPAAAAAPASLTNLLRERHARLIPGTRVSQDDLGRTGLRVILSRHLDNPASIGTECIDPLTYAAKYPGSQLTQPGDIVFRTGPTTAAWVDHDGSSVVAYPARVLRIRRADPGGLISELVAQDIATQPVGPGAWKRWQLRRVPPTSLAPLRHALTEIAATRAALTARLARLDNYTDALVAGTAAGAVTLTMSRPDGNTVAAAES